MRDRHALDATNLDGNYVALGLAEKLGLQAYLDELAVEELAEVYRTGTLPEADNPGERLEMGA
jgi:hypothetical protein